MVFAPTMHSVYCVGTPPLPLWDCIHTSRASKEAVLQVPFREEGVGGGKSIPQSQRLGDSPGPVHVHRKAPKLRVVHLSLDFTRPPENILLLGFILDGILVVSCRRRVGILQFGILCRKLLRRRDMCCRSAMEPFRHVVFQAPCQGGAPPFPTRAPLSARLCTSPSTLPPPKLKKQNRAPKPLFKARA